MEMQDREFIHPQILTILATYRCTAACENCCFDSNPNIKGRLSLEEIIQRIDDVSKYKSLKMVVFSGGECFLLGDDLTKAIKHCSSIGLMTRCVTNGYWAKSYDAGRRRLKELVDSGLSELNISTGDFHQKFVTQETVINAASIGLEMGITTLIVVESSKNSRITMKGFVRDMEIVKLHERYDIKKFQVIESPWMPMELNSIIEQDYEKVLNKKTLHLKNGCKSVFTTLSLNPYNKLGICCGLTREKIPELNFDITDNSLHSILESAGRDFMKIWLFIDGPEKILAWAASKSDTINWENLYSHRCHACWALFDRPEVREIIMMHYRERVDDVLLRYKTLLFQQEMLEAEIYN